MSIYFRHFSKKFLQNEQDSHYVNQQTIKFLRHIFCSPEKKANTESYGFPGQKKAVIPAFLLA